jgi:hypothetical protein
LTFADNAGEKSKKKNSLQPGSWALQFQLEQEFSLEPFDNLILAMKKHTSRHSAFRFGFDLDLEFAEDDDQESRVYADTIWSAVNTTFDRNLQRLELDFMYLNYPNPDALVNFFWGAGPLVMLSRSEINTERSYDWADGRSEIQLMENWSRSWSVGGRGLVGAEWFVTKAISFHAEYRISLRYINSRHENTNIRERLDGPNSVDTNEGTDEKWDLDAEQVILGVNLYF